MQKELLRLLKYLKKILARKFKQFDERAAYILTALVASIIFIAGVKIFIELTATLKSDYLVQTDRSVTRFVQQYRAPGLTDYFIIVTDMGDTVGYLVAFTVCTLLSYFIFKSWKYVVQIGLVMILALSSNLILKQAINRARPDVEHLVTVETLSYPSGHAMMSMAFYGFLIYLVSQIAMSKVYKSGIIILLLLFIASIGVSRIYLGVHFPSDVAGGFIAGFIWVVFCIMTFNLIKIFKRDPST